MGGHLGCCLVSIPGLNHRKDTSVLIGDHLRMQKVMHLNLAHA